MGALLTGSLNQEKRNISPCFIKSVCLVILVIIIYIPIDFLFQAYFGLVIISMENQMYSLNSPPCVILIRITRGQYLPKRRAPCSLTSVQTKCLKSVYFHLLITIKHLCLNDTILLFGKHCR